MKVDDTILFKTTPSDHRLEVDQRFKPFLVEKKHHTSVSHLSVAPENSPQMCIVS